MHPKYVMGQPNIYNNNFKLGFAASKYAPNDIKMATISLILTRTCFVSGNKCIYEEFQ